MTAEDFAANMQELSKEELKAVAGGGIYGKLDTMGAQTYDDDCGWCMFSLLW